MIERLLTMLAPAARGWPTVERLIVLVREEAILLRNMTVVELNSTAIRLRRLQTERKMPASILLAAFAAVAEAVRRTYGLELFDVQLSAGLAIARGDIAEMQTGEGKTFAAALPAFFQAIAGGGVHVVTPNRYLAGRDFELLAPVYRALGATVGLLPEGAPVTDSAPPIVRHHIWNGLRIWL